MRAGFHLHFVQCGQIADVMRLPIGCDGRCAGVLAREDPAIEIHCDVVSAIHAALLAQAAAGPSRAKRLHKILNFLMRDVEIACFTLTQFFKCLPPV